MAADQDWLAEPAHWALHPKYAGLPFFMGLSTRVLLEDMQTCVKALQRSLRGLGSLPTADARATFEILYAHSVSHHTLIFTPIVAALAGGDTGDRCDFGPELRALDDALVAAEVAQGEGPARRVELERALGASQALLASASQQLAAFSAKYVPRCITGFTSDDAIALFASVVQLYHTGNPHLLSRTVEALRVEEYETFCLGMLSLPFALLKEVLGTLLLFLLFSCVCSFSLTFLGRKTVYGLRFRPGCGCTWWNACRACRACPSTRPTGFSILTTAVSRCFGS